MAPEEGAAGESIRNGSDSVPPTIVNNNGSGFCPKVAGPQPRLHKTARIGAKYFNFYSGGQTTRQRDSSQIYGEINGITKETFTQA